MDRIENFASKAAQTYSQAPWRKQLQWIGVFSVGLVCMALIAGIYLNLSARTAAAGRKIQKMQGQILEVDRETEDLRAKLAFITSSSEMARRAKEQGFKPVAANQVVFLPVSGYIERQPVQLVKPGSGNGSRSLLPDIVVLPPEYSESLFEWLQRVVLSAGVMEVFR